eukprot:CAMPEP_0180297722 /NCGR_PEP_ID=MMETSP0988-20121125/20709_1 /TAXON_ID=697907 /ORGANISM="non described non described, Strain CCMP2293" /LENGTH=157 /DNA_ID=CAMNT_0022276437 /DNA_START=91 /DNA_END=560 /DNA_ORIENTATION=-
MLPLRALYAGLPPAKSQTNRVRDAFCKDDGRSPPDTRAACRAAACSMAWSSALELCAGAEGRSWSRAVALEAEAVMAGSEAAALGQEVRVLRACLAAVSGLGVHGESLRADHEAVQGVFDIRPEAVDPVERSGGALTLCWHDHEMCVRWLMSVTCQG